MPADLPTAREVDELLAEWDVLVDEAGGWAHRVDRDHFAAWEAGRS